MCLGIPGKILETFDRDGLPYGRVDFGGIRKEICLAYTPEAVPGEYVLVHVGFAISRLDEAEAEENLRLIREIEGELPGDPFEDGPGENSLKNQPEENRVRQSAEATGGDQTGS
ncbi:HypC/HybG/HupF family hydrogenase formation chaperone [Thermopirellula anaerolimosa]